MKTIFLIDGAAGTGKSDLMQYLASKKKHIAALVPKYTTRPKRQVEIDRQVPLDLHFPPDTPEEFRQRTKDRSFYWYRYGRRGSEHLYGFYRKDIQAALSVANIVLVIVRDFETIQRIKADFPLTRCVSVFVYADRDLIVKRLKDERYSDEEIATRLDRQPHAWSDYLKYSSLYDDKIVNSSESRDFEILIEALFKRFTEDPNEDLCVTPTVAFRLGKPLVGFRNEMLSRLATYPYERNVFLMMKFRESNKLVHRYIERTLAAHGLSCVRADDPGWNITRNTYNPVAVLHCCKYGIALFDRPEEHNEYSPNVAYELGFLHSQLKDCLVLRHSSLSQVPFDLVTQLYVTYGDHLELEEIITNWTANVARASR
jgi:guanylate kinase